mgnify:FL=1
MKDNIIINIKGEGSLVLKEKTTLEDLVKELKKENSVIAAKVNGELVELSTVLKEDSEVELVDLQNIDGARIYRSGLKFLYITAVKELFGLRTNVELKHSLDKGIYTRININVNESIVDKIKEKMTELVNKNLKIEKVSTNKKDAIKYFDSVNENEKSAIYKQVTDEVVTLYSLLDYYNYFYTNMPSRTGILKYFDLTLTKDGGVMLEYPRKEDMIIPPYTHIGAVLKVFDEYEKWSKLLEVNYVSEVNKIVIDGKIKEFIELNEIKQNSDLNSIANEIEKNLDNIKVVLIAGPSSSGKTTTSKKLSLYLKGKGINSFVLSTDDFFLERKNTPKNEKGEYLFDIPEAIDIELFNQKLNDLLEKKETLLPTYNFLTGEKEYKGKPVKLKEKDLIIIEGIHTLNDLLTSSIDRKNKYKIYISPFTPLGLDRHNHVSTLDLRLIRRLVRDYRTRGYSAIETLKNWTVVNQSEEKYIFPYQKEADTVLNTALIYELGVLKTYAVPILYSVDYKNEYYMEAQRIINFLRYFLDIPESALPNTALLREFVGGGYFE